MLLATGPRRDRLPDLAREGKRSCLLQSGAGATLPSVTDHQPGPLEQEIINLINREIGLHPETLAALTGTFDEAKFKALPPDKRRLLMDEVGIRNTRAIRAAVLRLAGAIDALQDDA